MRAYLDTLTIHGFTPPAEPTPPAREPRADVLGFEKNGISLYERVVCIDVPRLPGTVIRCDADNVRVRWDDGRTGDLSWRDDVAYNAYRLQTIRRALGERPAPAPASEKQWDNWWRIQREASDVARAATIATIRAEIEAMPTEQVAVVHVYDELRSYWCKEHYISRDAALRLPSLSLAEVVTVQASEQAPAKPEPLE